MFNEGNLIPKILNLLHIGAETIGYYLIPMPKKELLNGADLSMIQGIKTKEQNDKAKEN